MQKNITLRIKKLTETAVVPQYANPGDAGLDFTATSMRIEEKFIEYGTGLSIEIPDGFVGLLFNRSSVSNCSPNFFLRNAVGVIDSGYRGEVRFRFSRVSDSEIANNPHDIYSVGQRIGQLVIVEIPKVNIQLSDDLTDTVRGIGGYGSSGK